MALQLMYITNNPEIAIIAEEAGVDRIFVDMEYIGKDARQGGMNTVQNHHTIEDVKKIKAVIKKAKLLVRVNQMHETSKDYISSEDEINAVIDNGADIIMLPFFKTRDEVERFLSIVNGRVKTMLLLETPEAVECIDEILKLKGIDYVHIGLNDLSLGYGMKFMFELLTDGTVEVLCAKLKKAKIMYGFGGIASLGKGQLKAENVIMEHYRLCSNSAILSRSFCNTDLICSIPEIKKTFFEGLSKIREYERVCEAYYKPFKDNELECSSIIRKICDK